MVQFPRGSLIKEAPNSVRVIFTECPQPVEACGETSGPEPTPGRIHLQPGSLSLPAFVRHPGQGHRCRESYVG